MIPFTKVRFRLIVPIIVISMLLSACASVEIVIPTTPTPARKDPAQDVTLVTPTQAAQSGKIQQPAPTDSGSTSDAAFTLDSSDLAQSVITETVAAVPPSDTSGVNTLPRYVHATLNGYPIGEHGKKPQIFFFPAKELHDWLPDLGQQVEGLRALIAAQQIGSDRLPMMPEPNIAQMIRAQVKFMSFKNGQGVRYLTQNAQAVMPINNEDLFYTFQGLTNDGKYYIAAVMPLNYPGLPASSRILPHPSELSSDYNGYMAGMEKTFNEAPDSAFTPDLARLDAMIRSLEVR